MNDPGIKTLGDIAITTAGTQTGNSSASVDGGSLDLDGMLAATFSFRLQYGSGGTTVKAYLQTSLNQGTTWIDIACVAFATASEDQVLNLSGLTPKTTLVTPTDGALADDTCIDGIFGDRFRVKVVSAGTYAGSTVLSCRMDAR